MLNEEYQRGLQEVRDAIEKLRSLWPAAFPVKGHLIRPLVSGVRAQITEVTGWSEQYAHAVLRIWTGRSGYCQAVLWYPHRYDLSGAVTEQVVDEPAREHARRQLARNQAKRERRGQN